MKVLFVNKIKGIHFIVNIGVPSLVMSGQKRNDKARKKEARRVERAGGRAEKEGGRVADLRRLTGDKGRQALK